MTSPLHWTLRFFSPIRFAPAIALFLAMLFVATGARAQEVSVQARPTAVQAGDYITYTIAARVVGNEMIRIQGDPDFDPSFQLAGTTNAPGLMVRNGKAQRSLTRTYRLRATRPGTFTITAPQVRIGHEITTPDPVTITVSAAAPGQAGPRHQQQQQQQQQQQRRARPHPNPSAGDDQVFVAHKVEPTRRPYVGQQITLTYWLYSDAFRLNVQPQPPDEPSLDDFWIEDLSRELSGQRQTVHVNGKPMVQTNLRAYALFPLKAGPVEIEPLELDAITGGFLRGQRQLRLKSDPIKVEVRPLPPDAPDSFVEGNVGQWKFEVTTDRIKAEMGKPITIRVRARGTGQADRLTLPPLPPVPGTRVAGTNTQLDRTLKDGIVGGTHTAEYTLVAEQEGALEVPSLEFGYFDPEAEKYRTIRTEPIKIDVTGGKVVLADQPAQPRQAADAPHEQSLLEQLVARLPAPRAEVSTDAVSGPLARRTTFWVLLLLPLLGLLGLALERPLRRRVSLSRPRQKRGNAYKKALGYLRESSGASPAETLDAVRNAVSTYAVQVAQVPAGALSPSELAGQLTRRGAAPELAEQLAQLLRDVNTLRYSPTAGANQPSADALREDCTRCLKALEKDRQAGKWTSSAAAIILCALGAALAAATLLTPAPAHAQTPGAGETRAIDRAIAAQKAARTQSQDAPNKAAAAQSWAEAADLWAELARAHPDAPDLLFNLGIAKAHLGDFGQARLALERAALLAPNTAEITRAREQIQRIARLRQIEAARGSVAAAAQASNTSEGLFWWQLATAASPNLFPILLVVMVWMLFLSALGRRFLRSESAREMASAGRWIFAIAIVICAACWFGRAQIVAHTRPAVVLAEDPKLREGPSQHAGLADVRTLLVPGLLVPVEAENDGWLQLDLGEDTHPWTPAENLEFVRPD